jgi:hypothetical protein
MTGAEGDAVEVIVKLRRDPTGQDNAVFRELQARLAQLDIALQHLHPSTTDPELATYAVVHVNPADANAMVDQLTAIDGVEGVYTKPQGKPPEGALPHDQ